MVQKIIEFFYKIKKRVVNAIADIYVSKYPMFIMFGGIAKYKVNGYHERQILDLLKPGDILLRRYDHYLGSILVSGYWSHAAIYVGNNQVIHAIRDGLVYDDILAFLKADNIAILRSTDILSVEDAINIAKLEVEHHKEYDYDFNTFDNSKYYCSEFVAYCFSKIIKPTRGNLVTRGLEDIITPDDLLNFDFDVIFGGINGP